MRIELADGLSLHEVARAVGKDGASLPGAATIHALATDSRLVLPGDLFVALRGDRMDGHAFLGEARARGAACLLSEEEWEGAVTVPDTRAALLSLASFTLTKDRPRVIAITGSVGKTGTKDAVTAVLGSSFRVHKTQNNQNNELGLAFSVLSRPKGTEILVLELGTNHPGEIAPASLAIRPDFSLITAIGRAHIGAFGSQEAILAEKSEVLRGMRDDGLLFLNGDDPYLSMIEPPLTTRYVGTGDRAEYRAAGVFSSRFGTSYSLVSKHGTERIFLRGSGRPRLYSSLFAMAVAYELSIPPSIAKDALFKMNYAEGRQSIEEIGGILLIDDAYNASPESVAEALALLAAIGGGKRRIAVLGDMLELGEHAEELHREAGRLAARHATMLYTFGSLAGALAGGAREGGMKEEAIHIFRDAEEVSASLFHQISDGDVVLVKASHLLGGKRITEALRRRGRASLL